MSDITNHSARREILKGSLAAGALGALPGWVLPALAQGETLAPFTDFPASANLAPAADRRVVDIRRIDGPFTPADQFYTTQHYNQPELNPAAHRLHVSGLVDRPISLSLDDLRRMRAADLVAGFECSGNRRPLHGQCGNGRWTGVPLRAVLDRAGVKNEAREFVFFGADHGEEEGEFRMQKKVEQQFGRSLSRGDVLAGSPAEPFLAYALNGEPLTKHQGSPLRLIVPGWYGVSNVKWLSQIHVQTEQYRGRFQSAISRMKLKSFIARVTRDGSGHKSLGVVLNDGTPLRVVEVRVDDGPWRRATMDAATSSKYSWKLFTYSWNGATPGEHTIVSRVTDVNGTVQPTAEALDSKKTFLEDNALFPRKVMIS